MSLETAPIDRPPDDADLIEGVAPEPTTQWQLFRRKFVRHKGAMIGLAVLLLLMFACYGATWVAPYPKGQQDLLAPVEGPTREHWFGVDELGRDYLTEVLHAGKISLSIGLGVALLSTLVGVALGSIAGYVGRWADAVLMRLTDLFLVVPQIALLAIGLKKFGGSPVTIVLVLAALFWMGIARVVRGQVLSVKEKEFVEAARVLGASGPRIVVRHILPNIIGPITVNATLAVAAAIVSESTLSFLGFGVQRPDTSWGNMLSDARGYVGTDLAYLIYFPGLMLLVVTLAINFVGDGLRDALDPQTKVR
jgi:peptide/nickel transport system permease protein